jgi:hypothetical protein
MTRKNSSWSQHQYLILRRNFLLKQIIEGKIEGGIEVTGRQGRTRKQQLYDL